MARKRMIDPDIWTSLKFSAMSKSARLLFIGMFSNADDYGRLKLSPLWLKLRIFPADSDSVEDITILLGEVIQQRLVLLYQVPDDEDVYGVLPGWFDTQKRFEMYDPKYPPPPKNLGLPPSFYTKNEIESSVDMSSTCHVDDTYMSSTCQPSAIKGSEVNISTHVPIRSLSDVDKSLSPSAQSADLLTEDGDKETPLQTEDLKKVSSFYAERIQSRSRLTRGAKKKILTRLETFSVDEIIQAIQNFSTDSWWMEHNSHRGMVWFFHSDDRVEQFINLSNRSLRRDEIIPDDVANAEMYRIVSPPVVERKDGL